MLVECYDDQAGYERRLASETLQQKLAFTADAALVLLKQHSLDEIIDFARHNTNLLQDDLWLYVLSPADFKTGKRVGKTGIRLAWLPRCGENGKEVYQIGDCFYTLFTDKEKKDADAAGKQIYRLVTRSSSHLRHILDSPPVDSQHFSPHKQQQLNPERAVVLYTPEKRSAETTLSSPRHKKRARLDCLEMQLQLQIAEAQVRESEAQHRIVALDYERQLDQMKTRLAEAESEKKIERLESEKRAAEEKSVLQLSMKEAELRIRDKEIELLREKEAFLVERSKGGLASLPPPPPQVQREVFSATTTNPPSQPPATYETATASYLQGKENEEQAMFHQLLLPVTDQRGRLLLSVPVDNLYFLRDVLAKTLLSAPARQMRATDAVTQDERLIWTPLLEQYRIYLIHNSSLADAENIRMLDIFSPLNTVNRFNVANTLLHYAFLKKALSLNALDTLTKIGKPRKHEICVATDIPFRYGGDVLALWFPSFTAGVHTIVSESLSFYARSLARGAGENKCCPFCEQTFVCYRGGGYKGAHHLDSCDTLAHLGNNERVVLQIIEGHMRKSTAFATHELMRDPSSVKSILRYATETEVGRGHYIAFDYFRQQRLAYRLRLRMPVYLGLRRVAYIDFLERLRALACKPDPLYNLNTGPLLLSHIVDVLSPTATKGAMPPSSRSRTAKPPTQKNRPPEIKAYESAVREVRGTPLGLLLLNARGENFIENLKPRDFSIDPRTGFGDAMYFESEYDQRRREHDEQRRQQQQQTDAPRVDENAATTTPKKRKQQQQPQQIMTVSLTLNNTENPVTRVPTTATATFSTTTPVPPPPQDQFGALFNDAFLSSTTTTTTGSGDFGLDDFSLPNNGFGSQSDFSSIFMH